MKQYFFISGLPRTGSTLLTDLLSQNPDIYASPSSGVLNMVELVKNNWNGNEHFKATFEIEQIDGMIKGVFDGFYESKTEGYIFDKNRGWPGAIELANLLCEKDAKVIITVRKMPDIIASLEKMFRSNAHNFMLPQEKGKPGVFRTLAQRCEEWVNSEGMIGQSYNVIKEALNRGYRPQMLFVDYDNLCLDPAGELKRIYKFCDIDWTDQHYFDNVVSKHYEYEMARGFPQSLHQIREEVKPQKSDAAKILGKELFDKYSKSEFWSPFI